MIDTNIYRIIKRLKFMLFFANSIAFFFHRCLNFSRGSVNWEENIRFFFTFHQRKKIIFFYKHCLFFL
uniref:Uncharacterized protein n=1 Tax=Lutzomyia longipalpis TaxID=7200 RepID=A0A7G3B376_LUTLO